MKVILAGYSKCGTKTMQSAFQELGMKNYDFMENYVYMEEEWRKIYSGRGDSELFYKMFRDVDSVTDLPSFYFWEEIHKAFPDSKIILTTRGSEDEWFESMKKQLESRQMFKYRLMQLLSPTMRKMLNFARATHIAVWGHYDDNQPWCGPSINNEILLRKSYRRHVEYVLNAAPKDKLLVFNLADGWEPLCEFLDLPVPDVPFPHKNKNAQLVSNVMMSEMGLRMQREAKVSLAVIFGLLIVAIYKIISVLRRYGFSKVLVEPVTNFLKMFISV